MSRWSPKVSCITFLHSDRYISAEARNDPSTMRALMPAAGLMNCSSADSCEATNIGGHAGDTCSGRNLPASLSSTLPSALFNVFKSLLSCRLWIHEVYFKIQLLTKTPAVGAMKRVSRVGAKWTSHVQIMWTVNSSDYQDLRGTAPLCAI
jgi:hypothetical protein